MNSTYVDTILVVEGGKETVSAPSRQNVSGSNVDHPSRHVYSVTLSLGNSGWVEPNRGDPQQNFHSVKTWVGGQPCPQDTPNYGSPDTSNWTYNGESYATADAGVVPDGLYLGAVRPGTTDYTFYLLAPGEMGQGGVLGTATTVAPSSGTSPVAALGTPFSLGQTLTAQLGSSATLSGGTLTCLVKTRKMWHTLEAWKSVEPVLNTYWNPNTQQWESSWTHGQVAYFWKFRESTHWVRYDFSVPKLICDDASIDTRRAYGQPNLEGALPADPNSPERNVNFDQWIFRGGLFVGNIPEATRDQSGLARAQLYPRGGAVDATSKWATLSMVHMGVPPNRGAVADLAVVAYAPSASDPNASVPNTLARWANRWDKDMATAGQSITFGSSANTDYSNWHWDGKTTAIPTTLTSVGILLARATEDLNVFNWHYFASKEHVAPNATLPLLDAQPRLWLVKETTVTRW